MVSVCFVKAFSSLGFTENFKPSNMVKKRAKSSIGYVVTDRGSNALHDITKRLLSRTVGLDSEGATYVVSQGCVTVRLRQQQPDQVGVAVLACAHQRCGALVVLEVDVRAASQ